MYICLYVYIYSVCVHAHVCTRYRHVETLCLSSSSCCRLPSMDEVPPLCLAHTPKLTCTVWMGRGPPVSASSCVTRLISLQPGRLGPEGSGGGGAGPHSPSDKYVFGAAVLKGHGGGRRGMVCTVPGTGSQPSPMWLA